LEKAEITFVVLNGRVFVNIKRTPTSEFGKVTEKCSSNKDKIASSAAIIINFLIFF
jgi:hypothetical protein